MKNNTTNPQNCNTDFHKIPTVKANPEPLLGINKINTPALTLFYVLAWTLIPPAYDLTKSKTANKKKLDEYIQEFKWRVFMADINICHDARVQNVFEYVQRSKECLIPGRDMAKRLMTRYLELQFSGGVK